MKAGRLTAVTAAIAIAAIAALTMASGAEARGKIVADTGFSSTVDGYSFANYGNEGDPTDLTGAQMRKLFGGVVCSSFDTDGRCVLTPVAEMWMQSTNNAMADGHCMGFATTAELWFRGLGEPPTPAPYGSGTVPGLAIAGNAKLQSHIAYAWAFQMLTSVRKTGVEGAPGSVLTALRKGIDADGGPYVILIFDDGGGHAVTPTAIERRGEGRFRIQIYDNNWPGQTRSIHVNTKTQKWSYVLGPGTKWSGDATTKSLAFVEPAAGLGHQPCPFCKAGGAKGRGLDASGDRIEVHWRGDARDGRHGSLFVTDDRGDRTGCGRRGCENGIAGAQVWRLVTGGVRPWRFSPPPVIGLPGGRAYDVALGSTSLNGRAREGVDLIGPGFSLGAHRVGIREGESDHLLISRSARWLAFVNDRRGVESPTMSLSIAGAGDDYDFEVVPAGIDRGATVGFALHRKRRVLEIVPRSGGDRERFTVRMTRYTEDGTVTFRDRIRVRSGSGLELEYGRWGSPGEPAPTATG
ncbi:MAG: hypothetical protein U0R51_09535 [Solirubrobacterales bacterium]